MARIQQDLIIVEEQLVSRVVLQDNEVARTRIDGRNYYVIRGRASGITHERSTGVEPVAISAAMEYNEMLSGKGPYAEATPRERRGLLATLRSGRLGAEYVLLTDDEPRGDERPSGLLRAIGEVRVNYDADDIPYVCNSRIDRDFRRHGVGTWMYKAIINDLGVLRSDVTRSDAAEALWHRLQGTNPQCVQIVDQPTLFEATFYEAHAPVQRRPVRVRRHERRVR